MSYSNDEIGAILIGIDVAEEPRIYDDGEKTRRFTFLSIVPKENIENEETLRAKADERRAERKKAWKEGK